jgi:hypothetical protein
MKQEKIKMIVSLEDQVIKNEQYERGKYRCWFN